LNSEVIGIFKGNSEMSDPADLADPAVEDSNLFD